MALGNIIDGRKIADELLETLTGQVIALKQDRNIMPGLAVIQVGEDPASTIYVRNKMRCAMDIGIKTFPYLLTDRVKTTELLELIELLNNSTDVHGILVQLPLPTSIDTDLVLNTIDPKKDVDGFTWVNIGKLNAWAPCLESCTPQGAMILIKHALGEDLSGKKAVVLGRSRIVGRPMAAMLIRENCTVTIAHSYSQAVANEVKSADILVAATGVPNLVKGSWLKPGVCVIDVGIVRIDDKLYGDVDFSEAVTIAGHITPVPGGVGPMTVACLMSNTIKAASFDCDDL